MPNHPKLASWAQREDRRLVAAVHEWLGVSNAMAYPMQWRGAPKVAIRIDDAGKIRVKSPSTAFGYLNAPGLFESKTDQRELIILKSHVDNHEYGIRSCKGFYRWTADKRQEASVKRQIMLTDGR